MGPGLFYNTEHIFSIINDTSILTTVAPSPPDRRRNRLPSNLTFSADAT